MESCFADLAIALIGAPMAGGPSTPELAAAVTNAGGLGFLAGGYLTAEALRGQIAAARRLTSGPIGVNLFVPAAGSPRDAAALEAWAGYKASLEPLAVRLGAALPAEPQWSDDAYPAKLEVLIAEAPEFASFTFGLPDAAAVRRLHAAGTRVMATVTGAGEAKQAEALGVDAICAQGPEAGGHRATFAETAEPPDHPLAGLLASVTAAVTVPVVAAGGIGRRNQVEECLRLGAAAVQVGTALLGASEAGTKPAHLAALTSGEYQETVVTRAFTGRPARALATEFAKGQAAPALYPEVHFLTAPMRARAAALGEAAYANLWAGAGFRDVRRASAAAILESLTPRRDRR
jgi:nitronate monooxygenase